MKIFLLITLLLLTAATASGDTQDNSHGFLPNVDWMSTADMKAFNYQTNKKPIMYLFTQPWCGACKNLKRDLAANGGAVEALAKAFFVMVNVGGSDNDQYGPEYAPSGGYIPRILFAEPSGTLRPDVKNPDGTSQHPHYYSSAGSVYKGMETALRTLLSGNANLGKDEL